MNITEKKQSDDPSNDSERTIGFYLSRAIFSLLVALIVMPLVWSVPFHFSLTGSLWFWSFGILGFLAGIGAGFAGWWHIERFASLKLTAILLGVATLMVYVVTVQQCRVDIWDVKRTHFGEYTEHGFLPNLFVYLPVHHLRPPAWEPEGFDAGEKPFGLWLPSGLTVMILLMLNLAAAHLARFKLSKEPQKLLFGTLMILFGTIVTGTIVWISQNKSDVQGTLPTDPETMWVMAHSGLGLISLIVFGLAFAKPDLNMIERILVGTFGVGLVGLLLFMILVGQALFGDAGMRILWQLFQATVASVLLLIGCSFMFNRRGGIVLLHVGVGMLMVNEIFVSLTNVEQRILVFEGENKSIATDIRAVEFVIYDAENETEEKGTVVPGRFFNRGQLVSHDSLPVNFQFVEYYKNGMIRNAKSEKDFDKIYATQGVGVERRLILVGQAESTGIDTSQAADLPGGYVSIYDKETDENLGTFLVGEQLKTVNAIDEFEVNGKRYCLELRLKRIEKPYSLQLIDVTKEDYVGTNTPKHYGSDFILTDFRQGDRELRQSVSMNEPLRFGNETFYQSGYNKVEGEEYTVLQIVKNQGWMIPYLACMFVVIGTTAQLLTAFRRHLKGQGVEVAPPLVRGKVASAESIEEAEVVEQPDAPAGNKPPSKKVNLPKRKPELPPVMTPEEAFRRQRFDVKYATPIVIGGVVLVGIISLYMAYKFSKAPSTREGMNTQQFGQIPVTQHGRVMPLDSLGRNVLRKISHRESPRKEKRKDPTVSPSEWIADVMFQAEGWDQHRIYRVDDPKIRHLISKQKDRSTEQKKMLQRKNYTYTDAEIEAVEAELFRALKKEQENRGKSTTKTLMEKRIGEVLGKRIEVETLQACSLSASLDPNRAGDNADRFLGRLAHSFWEQVSPESQNPRDIPNMIGVPSADMPGDQADWLLLALVNIRRWADHFGEQDGNKNEFEMATLIAEKYYFPQMRERLLRKDRIQDRIIESLMAIPEAREGREDLSESELRESLREDLARMDPQRYQQIVDSEINRIDLRLLQGRQVIISRFALGIKRVYDLTKTHDLENAYEVAKRFDAMGTAYRDGDSDTFNELVEEQLESVDASMPNGFKKSRNLVEMKLNAYSPFHVSAIVYIMAMVFSILGWVFLSPAMRRLSFWVIGIAVVFQTVGLIARMYVSERAPVTNLYSSALFVGWIGVLSCLGLEMRNRLGTGNVLASFGGWMTLYIAGSFAQQGDTMGVLRAVLDTNFWLSTHVVTIAIGYAGTLLAGFLGVLYILTGVLTPNLKKDVAKTLENQIHLITCFSLLLSFFGTVLGGLWADDSWGRFWGWDTKENGALMIVLWNAVVLHARWGGLVKSRGLAMLAIPSAMIVGWSWFAVNELGVGLHQYGTTEGTMFKLYVFWGLMLGVLAMGAIPKQYWWSQVAEQNAAPVPSRSE